MVHRRPLRLFVNYPIQINDIHIFQILWPDSTQDVQTEYENLPDNCQHITPNAPLHRNLWKHQD